MEAYSQEQWLERLVSTGEYSSKHLRRDPAFQYTRGVSMRKLFQKTMVGLPDISKYGSWNGMTKLMSEVATMDLHWTSFTYRDYRKELKDLWTGDQREWKQLNDEAHRQRDPVEYLLKLVGEIIRAEQKRVPRPVQKVVTEEESNRMSLQELKKLASDQQEVLKKNQEISKKQQQLDEILESVVPYTEELKYQLFTELQVFREIINSTLFEMRQRYHSELPDPLTKRSRLW